MYTPQVDNISFALHDLPEGFFINTNTGSILGMPTRVQNVTSQLYATYPGAVPVLLYTVTFDMLLPDAATAANGPNGKDCVSASQRVDAIPFDHRFTCNCSSATYVTNDKGNCDPATEHRSQVATAIIAAFSAVSGLCIATYLHVKTRRQRLRQTRRKRLRTFADAPLSFSFDAVTNDKESETAHVLFDAIDLDCLELIPALVRRGNLCTCSPGVCPKHVILLILCRYHLERHVLQDQPLRCQQF